MANVEQNLREIAKAKGLKLSDIADRVGTTVSNMLSSVKGNPTVSKLEDIAAALQVSVSELLTKRPEAAQGIVITAAKPTKFPSLQQPWSRFPPTSATMLCGRR